MNFAKLNLSENIKSSISLMFDTGVFPHAVLITGGNVKERKVLAKHLAMSLVCTNEKQKPCLKCPQCLKAKNQTHPDITEIEKEAKKSNIPIDKIKELKRNAYILPNEADVSVFLIYEASDLKEDSQNSLLKILEEPPSYVRFILTSPNKEDLIETVISRVSHFPLSEQSEEKENAKGIECAEKVLKAIANKNEYELMLCTSMLLKDKNATKTCFEKLIYYLRNALLIQNGIKTEENTSDEIKTANNFTQKNIIQIIDALTELSNDILKNANENILLTRFSMEIAKSF